MRKILIELGSYYSRIGYIGEDKPEKVYRTQIIEKKKQFEDMFAKISYRDCTECEVVVLKDTGTKQSMLINEANILFDEFNVKGCAFANAQTAILSSWAHGYNGLIIDIGYQQTISAPIINGSPLVELCSFSNTAGKSIEAHINKDLNESGISVEQILKNKDDPLAQKINSLTNFIITNVKSSLSQIGARKLERLFFCGGGSLLLDLTSYLLEQLYQSTDLKKSVDNYEIGIKSVPSEQSAISSWLGGSILFSMSIANDFITNKIDYEKEGNTINFIEDKFFKAITEGTI